MNFCLGTVQFGTNYGIQGNGKPQHETVYEMLDYAIYHGIVFFDTASAYGEAEQVLGNYIKTNSAIQKKINIVSKLKPSAFTDAPVKEWANIAERNALESLTRIGIDSFSAYLFHNAAYIFDENAVKALAAVKERGLADAVGVSVYTPEEAMKALEYDEISVIQIPYNLFDRRLDKKSFFERALYKGVKVFARSSLLQGLVMMDPASLPDRVKFARYYLEKFISICSAFNIHRLDAAIGYVAQKKGIDYIVFGVDNKTQLQEYIALKDTILTDEMIRTIDTTFDEVEEKLINPVLWK